MIQRQEGEITQFQKKIISESIDRGIERAKFNKKVENIKRLLTLVITTQPQPNHPLAQQLEIERELLKLSGMDDRNSESSFNINQVRGISVFSEDCQIKSRVSELTEMLESEFIDSHNEEILKTYLGITNSTLTQEELDKFIENHPEIIIPLEQK